MNDKNVSERLDELRILIQTDNFLDGKGLSNEVNICIFCYDAKEEMAVQHFIALLHADEGLSCHVVECNLYRTFLEICNEIVLRIPF